MIHIGVTGHRILSNTSKIEAGVDEVLSYIDQAFPKQDWTILSSLAEGADCLFVEKALKYKVGMLIVPLPLSTKGYIETFSTEAAKLSFTKLYLQAEKVVQIEPKPTRKEAYLSAGLYVVHHCDVLVTIWDGEEAQGLGGTGQIVDYARKKLLPIAWIQAGNRHPGTLEPSDLGKNQGAVLYERFP